MATIRVCVCATQGGASNCNQNGGEALFRSLQEYGAKHHPNIRIEPSVCLGQCKKGPNLRIVGGPFFHRPRANDIPVVFSIALSVHRRIEEMRVARRAITSLHNVQPERSQ